ncbi:MAG: class I SAM-dependent methyltransferase [Bdellovibrionota bacterium]
MELSFLDPKLMSRIERSPREKDLMRDALGKNKNMRILDATAGFCRDALRLAYWGHTVTACERDPSLCKMLTAALEEAINDEFYSPWLNRLSFYPQSTESFLKAHPHSIFDIVVIDAMFPDEKRKGLPRKDLQDIKAIVADDSDNAEELLKFCTQFAWIEKPKRFWSNAPSRHLPLLSRKLRMNSKADLTGGTFIFKAKNPFHRSF